MEKESSLKSHLATAGAASLATAVPMAMLGNRARKQGVETGKRQVVNYINASPEERAAMHNPFAQEKTAFEIGFEKAANRIRAFVREIESNVGKVAPKFTQELAEAGKKSAPSLKQVARSGAIGAEEAISKATAKEIAPYWPKAQQFKKFHSGPDQTSFGKVIVKD